ncbi:MAG TPA: hypothetical protein VG871_24980, partial [Vicinamibacterales bacterium]|nr:hypothetical protein [Vicinamibacterales bacterium]
VVGVGYRLLPMVFPSRMPTGPSVYASAVLLEIGVLGLFTALLVESAWAVFFGVAIVAGLLAFAAHVAWMRRHLAPAPVGVHPVRFELLHAASAALSLGAAVVIGLVLLVGPVSTLTLDAAAAYGVLGLVGFLAQMIVAMESRLLPMATWFWAYRRGDGTVQPPAPHAMRRRPLQGIVLGAWTLGIPALALGMATASASDVRVGACALFVGAAIGGVDNLLVIRHAVGIPAIPLRRPVCGGATTTGIVGATLVTAARGPAGRIRCHN